MLVALALIFSSRMFFFPAYGYSEQTSAGNQDYIPMDIVAEASCYVESDAAGNQFVVLTYVNDVTLSKTGDRRNYEATTLAILAESDAERERLIQDIMRIKQSGSANRATGSYSDEKWYHSSSLCIEGTVYYSTVDSAGITYGKITDVYVQCNVVNSTVLDGISFVVGQYGYTLEGDAPRVYEVTKNNVGNRSTTSVSEELPYIKWDDTSFANACISATIHRGTSSQYTYTFYVPALGEVYNG